MTGAGALRTALLIALLGVVFEAPALASEAGADTFLGVPRWIWLWANLLLFLGLLVYYLGPPIIRFLEARGEEIRRNLRQARDQQAEAEEMRATLESKIADLRERMDELVARAEGEAERERQDIVEQAERERERFVKQTREEIAHRLARARQELTEFTADLAAELAQKTLESELGPDDRRRLFEENLRRLEEEAR
jgi:F-type H+-transporting ATPase subunit b